MHYFAGKQMQESVLRAWEEA